MPKTNVSRRSSASVSTRTSTVGSLASKKKVSQPHPGVIFVQFQGKVQLPYVDGVETYLATKYPQKWDRIKQIAPSATFKRVYTQSPVDIDAAIKKARVATNDRYEPPPWNKRFALHYREVGVEKSLLKELGSWKVVEQAYVAPRLFAPNWNGTNPRSVSQWYLQMAPVGIDVDYTARNIPGGAGEGQDFIDVEAGWMLDHPDLIAQNIPAPIVGTNLMDNVWRPHGTKTLGVVCAVDNNEGVVGIAAHVASVQVSSHSNDVGQYHQAVFNAVTNLKPGGVLLLETSLTWTEGGPDLPFETDEWIFSEIQNAVQNSQLVVVEPAGNGSLNLDTYWVDTNKDPILDRDIPARDSGAIVVGSGYNYNRQASWPANPDFHWRRLTSNYGRRIDCFGWGEMVYTTDPNAIQPTVPYSTDFTGTSSAAAMIAGAALVVQGMAENNLNHRLLPAAVRKLLSDERLATATNPLANTPTDAPLIDQIRVMPNLRAIAMWMLFPSPEPVEPPLEPPAPKRPKQRKKPKRPKKSKRPHRPKRKPH